MDWIDALLRQDFSSARLHSETYLSGIFRPRNSLRTNRSMRTRWLERSRGLCSSVKPCRCKKCINLRCHSCSARAMGPVSHLRASFEPKSAGDLKPKAPRHLEATCWFASSVLKPMTSEAPLKLLRRVSASANADFRKSSRDSCYRDGPNF